MCLELESTIVSYFNYCICETKQARLLHAKVLYSLTDLPNCRWNPCTTCVIFVPPVAPVTSLKLPSLSTATVGHVADSGRLRGAIVLKGNRLPKENPSMSLLRSIAVDGERKPLPKKSLMLEVTVTAMFGVTTDRCVVPSPSSGFPLLKR